jgi:tetratricopeptide (TPR) repeat protein
MHGHMKRRYHSRVLTIVMLLAALAWGYGQPVESWAVGKLIPVFRDQKFGYLDQAGKMVIPPQFDGAGEFSEGLAHVFIRAKNDATKGPKAPLPGAGGKFGYIDESGKVVIPPQFDLVTSFSEGMALVGMGEPETAKWGYINKTGKIVVPLELEAAGPFKEGLAPVLMERKWAFIDKSGKVAIRPQFDGVKGGFQDGLALVQVGKKLSFINKSGEAAFPATFAQAMPFAEGLAPVQVGKKWGYVDKTGNMAIPARFQWAERFQQGLARATLEGKGGVIDKQGKFYPQGSAEAIRFRVQGEMSMGRTTVALAEAGRGLARYPKNIPLLLAQGKILTELGRREKAIATYSKIIAIDSKNLEALKERGEHYSQEGRLEEALKDLQQAVALAPQDPWAHFKHGMVQFSLGNYQEAVADMSKAIQLNPEGPLFYFARGQIYFRHLDEKAKGMADFQKGCQLGHPLCCQELEKMDIKPKKD